MNLVTSTKLTRVKNAIAAGNGDTVLSDVIDTKGLDSVTFLVALGATGNGSVKLQQNHLNDSNTFADLAGTSVTLDANSASKLVAIEVVRPQERYLRAAVVRAANSNSAIDGIVALQTGADVEPVTQSTTVLAATVLPSPSEA